MTAREPKLVKKDHECGEAVIDGVGVKDKNAEDLGFAIRARRRAAIDFLARLIFDRRGHRET
jgi:hypothetical protein